MFCLRLSSVFLIAAFLAVGCTNPTDDRIEITGMVKLKNQPIKDGAIVMFEPLENQDTGGNATVSGGNYTIPKSNGLKPGKYLVRITAGDGKTAVNPVDPENPPGPGGGTNIMSKDLVPADWNVNSKKEIVVTKEGPHKFDFDIP